MNDHLVVGEAGGACHHTLLAPEKGVVIVVSYVPLYPPGSLKDGMADVAQVLDVFVLLWLAHFVVLFQQVISRSETNQFFATLTTLSSTENRNYLIYDLYIRYIFFQAKVSVIQAFLDKIEKLNSVQNLLK